MSFFELRDQTGRGVKKSISAKITNEKKGVIPSFSFYPFSLLLS